MRTIKFRAWVQENNRMIPVYGFNADHVFEDTLDGVDVGTNVFPAKTCELMQFTGLHDRNGKEIYEGDKILDTLTKVEYIVKFGFCKKRAFIGWYCENEYQSIQINNDSDSDKNSLIEVIGNIYEPSLTKKPQ